MSVLCLLPCRQGKDSINIVTFVNEESQVERSQSALQSVLAKLPDRPPVQIRTHVMVGS